MSVKNRADDFARDFDREVTRLFIRLQFDAAGARALDATLFLERLARWRASTSHAGLVQDVWLADDSGTRLWRLEGSKLNPSPWPAALTPIQRRIREGADALAGMRAPTARGSASFFRSGPRGPADFLDAENLALASPIPDFVAAAAARAGAPFVGITPLRLAGFTVVTLDPAYLREALLPALGRRHFGGNDEGEYTLAVTTRADPKQLIFSTSPSSALPGPGDARAEIFSVRMEEASEDDLSSLRMFRPAPPPRTGPEKGRVSNGGPGEPAVFAREPVEAAPRPRAESHGFFSGRRVGGAGRGETDGRWLLVATHRAGSVDQVVATARSRNLGVSAGILALLGVSVVLIVVSAQRARRLAERQLEFVAGVSHELRTPVAVIGSAGENLADGIVSDPKVVKRYGRVVRDEARRLAEMVEQVLDFAGSYAGRRAYRFEEVDLESLAYECLGALRPALDEAGASVEASIEPGLPPVKADRAAQRRAILNLLQNAIKYGGESPRVELDITGSRGPGQPEVRIAITDHGLGIAPAERERIFEPFVRGEAAQARQIRGSGLGLSLVSRIVEAHSGRITLTSTPGQGSTFVVSLPASSARLEDRFLDRDGTRGTAHPAG
jgi:signal transduction histidine kinase